MTQMYDSESKATEQSNDESDDGDDEDEEMQDMAARSPSSSSSTLRLFLHQPIKPALVSSETINSITEETISSQNIDHGSSSGMSRKDKHVRIVDSRSMARVMATLGHRSLESLPATTGHTMKYSIEEEQDNENEMEVVGRQEGEGRPRRECVSEQSTPAVQRTKAWTVRPPGHNLFSK
jgi:hypothetical protein